MWGRSHQGLASRSRGGHLSGYRRVVTDGGLMRTRAIAEDCLAGAALGLCGGMYRAWGSRPSGSASSWGWGQWLLRLPGFTSLAMRARRPRKLIVLLVVADQPVSYIAGTVGYASLANFNRQFRALKQMTPREFIVFHSLEATERSVDFGVEVAVGNVIMTNE